MALPNALEPLFSSNRVPTDEERAELEDYLTECDGKLDAITRKISDLEAQLQGLKEEKATILEAVVPYKRATSPFRRLPEDVVREIFVACLATGRNPTMANIEAPVLLTQISSDTRRISLTTPALWAAIHISIIDDVGAPFVEQAKEIMKTRAAGVREWLLHRSGSLPLRISFYKKFAYNTPNKHHPEEIMDILLSCCSRWTDVTFACSPEILVRVAALAQAEVPLLRSFYHYAGSLNSSGYVSIWAGSGILAAPNLTMYSASFRGRNSEDLTRFPINWSNLTHLSLPDISSREALPNGIISLAHILRKCTRLVSCNIPIHQTGPDIHIDAIYLPCLKVMIIHGLHTQLPDALGILASIHAPALETVICDKEQDLRCMPTPLMALLDRAPNVQELSIGTLMSSDFLIQCLRRLPLLRILCIEGAQYLSQIPEADTDDDFLNAFVLDDATQCLCPRLEYFRCDSSLYVSAHSLRNFVTRKLGDVPHLTAWKGFTMGISYHIGEHICDELRSALVGTGIKAELFCEERLFDYQLLHKLSQGVPSRDIVEWWPGHAIWPSIENTNTPLYKTRGATTAWPVSPGRRGCRLGQPV